MELKDISKEEMGKIEQQIKPILDRIDARTKNSISVAIDCENLIDLKLHDEGYSLDHDKITIGISKLLNDYNRREREKEILFRASMNVELP